MKILKNFFISIWIILHLLVAAWISVFLLIISEIVIRFMVYLTTLKFITF